MLLNNMNYKTLKRQKYKINDKLIKYSTCRLTLAGVNWLRIGCKPVASAAVL